MSETVHFKGTLENIPVDVSLSDDEKTKYLISLGYHVSEYDMEEDFVDNNEIKKLNGKFYKFTKIEYDDHDDIIEAKRISETTIEYEVKYYNGGCCFEEALEMAITKMEGR